MGQWYDRPQKYPEPGCFFTHKAYENAWTQIQNWVGDGRITDCDCREINLCPRGPPPTPPWDEFIRPLLELEGEQVDFIAPAPTAVPGPEVTLTPWDWRPSDIYPWPDAKPEYRKVEHVGNPKTFFTPWIWTSDGFDHS